MAQPQGVDGEPPSRLRRKEGGDGFGRCRQGSLSVRYAPVGEGCDGGTVSAPQSALTT
jgi:hypothetical protein